jgi:hydroxyacylglutathione hydrolase
MITSQTPTSSRGGRMRIECLDTPGHAHGHLSFLVHKQDVFTADVLFADRRRDTRARSDRARGPPWVAATHVALPDATRVHPGHREPTTIGRERANNPFVQALIGERQR